MAPRGPVLCAPAQRLRAEPAGRGRLLSRTTATARVLPPVRAPSASPRGRQDGATARAAGTAGNEARSAQTGRTGRTAQTARAAQPIAVAARMVCAADWAALPSANRPYGRRQLPEHAMSVPFQKDYFFCLFGKIWIKNPPHVCLRRSQVPQLDLAAKRTWYKINFSNSERVPAQNQFHWLPAVQK